MTDLEFEQLLQEALVRLYDPGYAPAPALCAILGCEPAGGALAVQAEISRALESLRPSPEDAADTQLARAFTLLHHRFVLRRTQEETAELMFLSRSSIQRVQREAVHLLARVLWENQPRATPYPAPSGDQAEDWQAQAQLELAALQNSAPATVSDVTAVVQQALEVIAALSTHLHVEAEAKYLQPSLKTTVHPAALQQIIITAVQRLAHYLPGSRIAVFARLEDGDVKITLTATLPGAAAASNLPRADELTANMLKPAAVTLEVYVDGPQVYFWIRIPSTERTTVLIVDDNADMYRFYCRAADGTRYRLVHTPRGQGLFEAIAATSPDLVVLDVMLPDIDGWRLLMRLHENPVTRALPVIVCSVVKDEALALSLGAAGYLMKPVRPRDFIAALDRAVPERGSARGQAAA